MSTMAPEIYLSLTGQQHDKLRSFLFPGDGKEAAAIALCGRRSGERRHRLLVREIHGISYEACSERSSQNVTWSTDVIVPYLNKAEEEGLSIVKFHSHPGNYPMFSETDDSGDKKLLPAVRGYIEADVPHASVVMLPDGGMFGRALWRGEDFRPLACIAVTGPDIRFWHDGREALSPSDFTASHKQAFGAGTTEALNRLSVAVIGCSGTGSPLVEQLVRLGVGELILVDDDHVEERNVNRILNSSLEDARCRRQKVDVLADAIGRIGLGTRVRAYHRNLADQEVIWAVAESDVVFGCMDTIYGRFLLNLIATYYILPYFDLGVRLDAVPDGQDLGRIREVCGTVHYLQPGRSSLINRGLVSLDEVRAEGLRSRDSDAYVQQVKDGYIRGVQENRPAVISVNMFIASLAVNDFLARLHPYREMPNMDISSIELSLSSLEFFTESENEPCSILGNYVGRGDVEPLLGQTQLSVRLV